MNLNQGKRNKHALSVFNEVIYNSDGMPIGMREDNTNPESCNFGTYRDNRRGGCYLSNGVSYIYQL